MRANGSSNHEQLPNRFSASQRASRRPVSSSWEKAFMMFWFFEWLQCDLGSSEINLFISASGRNSGQHSRCHCLRRIAAFRLSCLATPPFGRFAGACGTDRRPRKRAVCRQGGESQVIWPLKGECDPRATCLDKRGWQKENLAHSHKRSPKRGQALEKVRRY